METDSTSNLNIQLSGEKNNIIPPHMKGTAEFSPNKTYRYVLSRDWSLPDEEKKTVLFIMLNPSTADENVFDPTVRRCFGYAVRWGFNVMKVANIYAYRATNPKDMLNAEKIGIDIIGLPENDLWITKLSSEADKIICAWGAMKWSKERETKVLKFLTMWHPDKLYCLRKTKDGRPVHPLYQRNDVELIKLLEEK